MSAAFNFGLLKNFLINAPLLLASLVLIGITSAGTLPGLFGWPWNRFCNEGVTMASIWLRFMGALLLVTIIGISSCHRFNVSEEDEQDEQSLNPYGDK